MTTIAVPTAAVPILKGRPLIGHLPEFRRDPLALLETGWRQAGEVYALNVGPRTLIVVSHPDLAQTMLVDGKHLFQRTRTFNGGTPLTFILGLSVLTTDGDSWLAKRRLMQPIFHRARIQAMGATMAEAAQRMLARWEGRPAGSVLDLADEMKLVTLDIINRTMFSADVLPEVGQIGETVDISLHYITDRLRALVPVPASWPTPANRRFQKARATLDGYLYRLIRERRQTTARPGDLLDMLLDARDEATGLGMDDEQVRNEVVTVYGAGHETTALALTWTWYALSQNPDVRRKLQQEVDTVLAGRAPTPADLPRLSYTLAVLEESMRLYPPVPFTARTAEQAAELGGYAIPKGAFVLVAINNLHRHPEFWDEPEAFRPERFLPENKARLHRQAYMPFLTGPHLCIGRDFALMEGQLLLAAMAQRYDLPVAPGQTVEKDVAVTMRPRHGLKVQLTRRN